MNSAERSTGFRVYHGPSLGVEGPEEVPWQSLAFPTMEVTLRRYFEDRRHGEGDEHFPLHLEQIDLETREHFFNTTFLPAS